MKSVCYRKMTIYRSQGVLTKKGRAPGLNQKNRRTGTLSRQKSIAMDHLNNRFDFLTRLKSDDLKEKL